MEARKLILEYADLDPTPLAKEIVYGPVTSRRLGQTLGINLLGSEHKVCSFDCPYCDLGRTTLRLNKIKSEAHMPTPPQLADALLAAIRRTKMAGQKIDAISISGNGEPTLHPEFRDMVEVIVNLRNEEMDGVPIVVLTNAVHLDNRKVIEGLNRIDSRMIKVDAGGEKLFKKINAPLVRASASKIISGSHLLKDFIVQSLFVKGVVDNTGPSDLEDWFEVIGLMKPKAVHVYSMSRVPATTGLIRVTEDELDMIASRLERKTQIKSIVFG